MTVSRHVQSVRSVHRRGTYRKSGFVIGRYGNTIPVHCILSHPSFSFVSTRSLEGSPTPLPFNLLERSASPRISSHRPAQRRVSLCISSRRAACRLRSAWNFIFGGLHFADEWKTRVHLPCSLSLSTRFISLIPLVSSFFSNFLRLYCILKDLWYGRKKFNMIRRFEIIRSNNF